VLGPGSWGWTGYFYSPRDRGTDRFRSHADRRAHGNIPFLAWWLDQVRRYDERAGRRSLDYLDVHFYPQAPGVYAGASEAAGEAATNALRLRSTRALWDPAYVDESWIGEPVQLIPRLRDWVDRYYPGTGIAITEWNWGAESTVNGALAIADVLGIFGREGVDLAAYWTFPRPGSPGALAFSLYTNYDGKGSGFGDVTLPASSDTPDAVAAYASLDSRTGDVVVMTLNKLPDTPLPLTLAIAGVRPDAPVQVHRYGRDDPAQIKDLGQVAATGGEIALVLPPYSIAVLRAPAIALST
jgi:hypothetical protein